MGRGIPRLMRRGMRKLKRSGDVAAGIDVRIDRLQIRVGFDSPVLPQRNAELFEAEPGHARRAPDGAQDGIAVDALLLAGSFDDYRARILAVLDSSRLVRRKKPHSIALQRGCDGGRGIRILAEQYAIGRLHDRYRGAESCLRLSALAADRT